MKIILSKVSGGKSSKIAKLASEYSKEGISSHIISWELEREEYLERVLENNGVLEHIKHTTIENPSTIKHVVKLYDSEVILVDTILYGNSNGKSRKEALKHALDDLKELEDSSGKKFYVTVQASNDDERLEKESLIVYDYEDFSL